MSHSIQLSLSETQFQTLTKLVFLGDWFLNSHRDAPTPETHDVTQIVYAHAAASGMEDRIEHDTAANEFSPTLAFDAEMYPFIEEYNDEMFWEEFIERLSLRDLLKEYSMDQLAAMSHEERIAVRQPFVAKYEDIFDRVGMDSVSISEAPTPLIQIN